MPATGVPIGDERHVALEVGLEADARRVAREDVGGVGDLREGERRRGDRREHGKANDETDVPGRSHLELLSAGSVMDFNPYLGDGESRKPG